MKQNYRTWITINQSALLHNYKQLAQLVAPQKFALVVKGNAYGHGLLHIAQCVDQSPDVALLCVAFLHEAQQLRTHGITKPIMILCAIDDELDSRWCESFIFLVDDLHTIKKLSNFGKQHNKVITVHLKVDVGLARRGFSSTKLQKLLTTIKNYTNIRVTGLCSHLSSAKTDPKLTQQQLNNFNDLVAQTKKTMSIKDVHVANSSSLFYNTQQTTLVRIGLMTYGYWSSPQLQKQYAHRITLKPILSWYTRIMQLKNLPAGVGVGYNHTFITKRPTRIALLPIGYADGYPQQLSNCGYVLVHNQQAPIIGTISMNITVIDVTDIANVQVNNHVTLLDQTLHAQKLTNLCQQKNIRYLFSAIKESIPRIIINQFADSNKK